MLASLPCRVVLNASALPDPREVDYDLLLSSVSSPFLLLTSSSDTTIAAFSRILTFMVRSPPSSISHSPDGAVTQWNLIIPLSFLLLEANIPLVGTGCGRLTVALVGSIVRILNDW